MNIRPLESLTKEELIELIKHEREHIEQPLEMVDPVVKDSLTTDPTDTEMLDWMIDNEAVVSFLHRSRSYEVWFRGVCVETGKTEREAIAKAMRDEE